MSLHVLFEFYKSLEKYTVTQLEKPKSSLGYKYPTFRDHPLHPPELWIRSKQQDEGAEGLWRIEDDLYDFTEFIDKHPGGKDWLESTKGTDITEAFEVHHISSTPRHFLKTFFTRKAKIPRNSPFTFEENGFYKTLKKHVKRELGNVPASGKYTSMFFIDMLLFTTLATSLISVKYQSYLTVFISGLTMTLTTIAAHNFFHQRDNFRMYYFNLSMLSSRNWRITHALSHHIYTNTVYDYEISSLEPFLQYLPVKKNYFVQYVSWLYSPIFYTFIYTGAYIRLLVYTIMEKKFLPWPNYIPLLHFLFLFIFGNQSLLITLVYYLAIMHLSSFIFGIIGLNAAHHHPDLFHDGDEARTSPKIDWGLHQMDAVMDRKEVVASPFFGLISFGDHALHHLFPTLDHGSLSYLYPVFKDVCKQFDININVGSNLDLIWGQFRQLAKVTPRKSQT